MQGVGRKGNPTLRNFVNLLGACKKREHLTLPQLEGIDLIPYYSDEYRNIL